MSTVAITLLASSCATTTQSRSSKTMSIYGPGVIQKPIIAELEVKNTQVTGTFISSGAKAVTNIESIKSEAVADALKKAKADVIVEPKYDIISKGGKVTVIVTGYPATYTKFRPLEESDIPLLEAGIIQRAETKLPTPEVKSTATAKAIVWVLLGTAVIVGLIAVAAGGS